MEITQDRLDKWEKMTSEAVEGQKSRPRHMAAETRKVLEQIEQESEQQGKPLPKRSHLFAEANLWPEKEIPNP